MFLRVSTQWRVSMRGPVGLDYNPLFQLFDLYAITDRQTLFEDVQAMERAALAAINKTVK